MPDTFTITMQDGTQHVTGGWSDIESLRDVLAGIHRNDTALDCGIGVDSPSGGTYLMYINPLMIASIRDDREFVPAEQGGEAVRYDRIARVHLDGPGGLTASAYDYRVPEFMPRLSIGDRVIVERTRDWQPDCVTGRVASVTDDRDGLAALDTYPEAFASVLEIVR